MQKQEATEKSSQTKLVCRQGNMSPPEIEYWMVYSWEIKGQVVKNLGEAAKHLSIMMTVAVTFFVIVFGKTDILHSSGWILKSVFVLWCVSLILSLLVIYPQIYRFNPVSAESIRNLNDKVIKWKQIIFGIAIICFILGILLLLYLVCLSEVKDSTDIIHCRIWTEYS